MDTSESTLSKILNRPRFKVYTTLSNQQLATRLERLLKENTHIAGNRTTEHAELHLNTPQMPPWKPYLFLRPEEEDGRTVLRGSFGPSSTVWTFFMFLNFLFGIAWMVCITLWYVGNSIQSDDYTWGFPLSFLCLILLGLTYLAAMIGRKKGEAEMAQLRKFAAQLALPIESEEVTAI